VRYALYGAGCGLDETDARAGRMSPNSDQLYIKFIEHFSTWEAQISLKLTLAVTDKLYFGIYFDSDESNLSVTVANVATVYARVA
jgi:hypothetical protein